MRNREFSFTLYSILLYFGWKKVLYWRCFWTTFGFWFNDITDYNFKILVAHASGCLRDMNILQGHIVRAQRSISRVETALCQKYGDSVCVCCAWHKSFRWNGKLLERWRKFCYYLFVSLKGCIRTKLKLLWMGFSRSKATARAWIIAFTDLYKHVCSMNPY